MISCQDSRSFLDNEKSAFKQLEKLVEVAEEAANNPKKSFKNFQEFIDNLHTEKEQARYKAKFVDNKKRSSRDRCLRKISKFDD